MPSKNQHGTDQQWTSEAAKMLQTKNHETLIALIKGMQTEERITDWLKTEADGQARTDIIAALNKRKQQLAEEAES